MLQVIESYVDACGIDPALPLTAAVRQYLPLDENKHNHLRKSDRILEAN
jgi:hypothetical protein